MIVGLRQPIILLYRHYGTGIRSILNRLGHPLHARTHLVLNSSLKFSISEAAQVFALLKQPQSALFRPIHIDLIFTGLLIKRAYRPPHR